MRLRSLRDRPGPQPGKRTQNQTDDFKRLLDALRQKQLPEAVIGALNLQIDALNEFTGPEKEYRKALSVTRYKMLKYLEKEHKIVPRNHYQKTWLALGLAVFGVPLGAAMGLALGNMAFMGAGIGAGLPIGMAVGAGLDKKAKAEGRQLDYESRM